ncbi:MAG: BrnT family toxin [Vitreoscilla sp.]|nr:BrnT family toxin [Polaromonas sp.]
MHIRFEWSEQNAIDHLKKHKISFELATRVFADPFMLMAQDRIENGEQRWQSIGMVDAHVVVLVAHTASDDEDGTEVIRIISARKADKQERKRYENAQH